MKNPKKPAKKVRVPGVDFPHPDYHPKDVAFKPAKPYMTYSEWEERGERFQFFKFRDSKLKIEEVPLSELKEVAESVKFVLDYCVPVGANSKNSPWYETLESFVDKYSK